MAELRELLLATRDAWPDYKNRGVAGKPTTTDRTHPVYDLVVNQIPDGLRSLIGPGKERFKVTGSTGVGHITAAPWIGVFDLRITDSATHGLYPVYLYSVDLDRLYLSMGIGVTEFQKLFGASQDCLSRLERAREIVASAFDLSGWNVATGVLDLGADRRTHRLHPFYAAGSVANIPYELDQLPPTAVLESDFRRILQLYGELIESDLVPDPGTLAQNLAPEPESDAEIEFAEFVPEPPTPSKKTARAARGQRRRRRDSKRVGNAGERLVVKYEQARLRAQGRPDLAKRVRRLEDYNEYPGWDVQSFFSDGSDKLIEVKSTTHDSVTSVELTANEWRAATVRETAVAYHLYVVTGVLSQNPRIYGLANPAAHVDAGRVLCRPSVYELRWRTLKT